MRALDERKLTVATGKDEGAARIETELSIAIGRQRVDVGFLSLLIEDLRLVELVRRCAVGDSKLVKRWKRVAVVEESMEDEVERESGGVWASPRESGRRCIASRWVGTVSMQGHRGQEGDQVEAGATWRVALGRRNHHSRMVPRSDRQDSCERMWRLPRRAALVWVP